MHQSEVAWAGWSCLYQNTSHQLPTWRDKREILQESEKRFKRLLFSWHFGWRKISMCFHAGNRPKSRCGLRPAQLPPRAFSYTVNRELTFFRKMKFAFAENDEKKSKIMQRLKIDYFPMIKISLKIRELERGSRVASKEPRNLLKLSYSNSLSETKWNGSDP